MDTAPPARHSHPPTRQCLGNEIVWLHPDFQALAESGGALEGLFLHGDAVPAGGRGGAKIVHAAGADFVVRKYFRGGLPGRLIRNTFVYLGEKRVRGVREFSLLLKMQSLGLPVPRPAATFFTRKGLVYECGIVLEYIPDVQPMAKVVPDLSEDQWYNLGSLIRRFHAHGIYHADLNAYNILLGKDGFYVIDFDKCYQIPESMRALAGWWMRGNLKRLLRSLNKECHSSDTVASGWQYLLRGYWDQ